MNISIGRLISLRGPDNRRCFGNRSCNCFERTNLELVDIDEFGLRDMKKLMEVM
ncbi:hypothetical protein [Thermococcus sp.]